MNCPSELTCSLYVDGVLPPGAAAELEQHLQGCAGCAARVTALRTESLMLRNALQAAEETVAVPAFEQPLGALGVLVFGGGAALVAWLAAGVWRSLRDYVPAALDWVNPFHLGGLWDLFVSGVLFFLHEGTAMIGSVVTSISVASAVALAAFVMFAALKTRRGAPLVWSVLLLVIVMPTLGHAIEIRREAALVNVAAGETIDDTLVLFSESATIDGTVTGDVIAFTRTLTVRGEVMGDVIGVAQSIELEGNVGGTVYGFGRSIDVRSQVTRNVFGFGSDVTIGNGGDVRGNAMLFANNAVVRGRVGTDVTAFAADLEVSGEVGRDVEVHAQRVRIIAPGRIGGDLRASTGNADNVQIAGVATIGGTTDVQVDEEIEERSSSRYLTVSFYIGQVLRVCAAFVVGLLLLWAFPALRTVTLESVGDALKASVLGLAATILLPIVSVIALITIIGIPLGIVGFIAWLLGLYFAKIVVAVLIGRRLFASPSGNVPHHAALLIVGLVLIAITVNLPYVGGILNFVLVMLGLGMLVLHVTGRYNRRYA